MQNGVGSYRTINITIFWLLITFSDFINYTKILLMFEVYTWGTV